METQTNAAAARLRQILVLALGAAFLACGLAMLAGATLVAAWAVSLILTLAASLGAVRESGLGPFKPYFIAGLLVWLLAFALMHELSASTEQLILGLPPATAASVFILWLAPLFLVTLPYSLHFESGVLSAADLEALKGDADPAQVDALERQLGDGGEA